MWTTVIISENRGTMKNYFKIVKAHTFFN